MEIIVTLALTAAFAAALYFFVIAKDDAVAGEADPGYGGGGGLIDPTIRPDVV